MSSALLSIFALLLIVLQSSSAANEVVCYFGSWATYRPGNGKFDVENINPSLCTYAIYGFAGLDGANRIVALDAWNDLEDNGGKGAYKRFNALRTRNSNLKTLIAIGGWNEGSAKYSAMAASAATRQVFVQSCVDFVRRHGFNGLDVDWEYPAARGGSPADKQNFAQLLRELRTSFDPHGLLLTAAVSAGKATIDGAYDVPAISQSLHLINLMAYDYFGSWDSITGHNAPLRAFSGDTAERKLLNVEFSVDYWLNLGAPASKLCLGLGSYGRSFTLTNSNQNGLRQPAQGAGAAGPFTREAGTLGYNEICENVRTNGWSSVFDTDSQAPYAFRDNQWVGYDDPRSIEIKCNYAKSKGLGGVMVWSLETDDFRGTCSGTDFPLLRTMNRVFRGT